MYYYDSPKYSLGFKAHPALQKLIYLNWNYTLLFYLLEKVC